MQETIEQILDYIKGIWLKRRFIMISTWLLCPAAWVYIAQMNDVYQSEARVYADTQSILGPLLKGMVVQTNPDVQINLMVRTLLSRDNVERIARMTDLDIQAETPEQYEMLLDKLKKDIVMKKSRGRANIFTITYEHKNADVAKNVVQSALKVFIENTIGENRNDNDSAKKFLDTQLDNYEQRLSVDEKKLAAFKQKYSDILPNQYGGYYNKLSIAREQLKAIELSLSENESQLENARSQLSKNVGKSKQPQNEIKDENSITTNYDIRIAELEVLRDSLLLNYTEKYPDVVEATKRLDYLQQLRKKEIDDYLSSGVDKTNPSLVLSDNPVVQNLQIQVNQYENMLASNKVRRDNYLLEVQDLENKVNILPEIEAELVALNRGYDITKKNYEQLLVRKETAQLAQQANESTSKINFKIIDPPRAPTKPSGPKRILLYIATTVIAAGAGVGLSFLFSQINPVVTSASQVSKITGIPVFGAISATENLGLQQWNKKKRFIFIISNSLLLGLLGCFILYSLFPEAIKTPFTGGL